MYLHSTAHGTGRQPTRLSSGQFGVPFSKDVLDSKTYTIPRGGRPAADRDVNQPAVDARGLGARPEGAHQPARDARSLGARPAQRSDNYRNAIRTAGQEVNQPVDARSLGARPQGAQESFSRRSVGARRSAGQEVNQPVDARSLGAMPEGAQGPSLVKKVLWGSSVEKQVSPEGSRFQSRNPPGGNGVQSQRVGGRVGRPRASRNNEDSEPKRRQRGGGQGSNRENRFGPKEEQWTKEEKQYLEEKAERQSQKPEHYEPVESSKEAFIGIGPATASDEWGMIEMLGERLLLARKLLDRKFIQWDSKEQKADVMAVVEKLKAVRRGRKPNGDMKTASPTSANGDQQAQALMQKLIAGEYAKFRKSKKPDVLGQVEMSVHRNDSFYPDDEKSLLEKVRSILPGQALKGGRSATNKMRA